MADLRIEGTYTALVTPFRADEAIDWAAFDALVESQIEGGVQGIVPCGTTGESPSLSHAEHREVIERSVARARGRTQVIANRRFFFAAKMALDFSSNPGA